MSVPNLLKDNIDESLEKLSVEKASRYTWLIWLFAVMCYLAFCFYDELKLLFYITILPLVVAALKEPARFKALMFPKSVRDWFWESNIIIACRGPENVRLSGGNLTWKQQIPGALLLSNVIPVILLVALSHVLYTPVLDLDEMHVYEGSVERVSILSGRGSRTNPIFWLRTTSGKIVKLVNIRNKEEMEYLRGLTPDDVIKVWVQYQWRVWGPNIGKKKVWQLKHGDIFLHKYNKNVRLQSASTVKKILYIILGYLGLSVTFLWIKGAAYKKRELEKNGYDERNS